MGTARCTSNIYIPVRARANIYIYRFISVLGGRKGVREAGSAELEGQLFTVVRSEDPR